MNVGTFLSIFGFIFVAELPDKTAVAALVLASKHKPWPVFLGTAAALVVQSLIAVVAGGLLSKLPARPVQIGSATVFLVSAVLMWRKKEEKNEDEAELGTSSDPFGRTLATVFGVVFLAELGDLTQVSTAALAAKLRDPVLVFLASSAALISVAALAVVVGNRAGRFLKGNTTQRVAAVVFALVGVAMLIGWPKAQ